MNESEPYIEGYNMGLYGKEKLYCPYEEGSNAEAEWMNGYQRGYDLAWFTRKEVRDESSIFQD